MTTSGLSSMVHLFLITLICGGMIEGGCLWLARGILESPCRPDAVDILGEQPAKKKPNPNKKIHYKSIVERNLFGPPPDKKQSAISPADDNVVALATTPLQIVLMGTITGSEGVERAIILDKKNQQQQLFEKGEAIQGASVNEIRRGTVVMSQAGKKEILDISEAAKERHPVNNEPAASGPDNMPLPEISQTSATPGEPAKISVPVQPGKKASTKSQLPQVSSPDRPQSRNNNLRIIPKGIQGE